MFVLDNIGWDVRVHDMRYDNQNKSVHAVATSIVFDRVSSKHLPDDGPKRNLGSTNVRDLVRLSDEERRSTRERYKIFLGTTTTNNNNKVIFCPKYYKVIAY